MLELCTDNRFELIDKYRQRLIEATNIETSPDEMKALDGILFRFWQMGWLDRLEEKHGRWESVGQDVQFLNKCSVCESLVAGTSWNYCPCCGAKMENEK